MELKMKHRIVGVLVVLGLAVIIITMLYTRGDQQSTTPKLTKNIPIAPAKPQTQLNLPQQPTTVNLTQQQPAQTSQADNGIAQATQALEEHAQGQPVQTTAQAPAPTKPVAPAVTTQKTTPTKATTTKPAASNSKTLTAPTAKAFTVQLAAFGNSANAKKLVDELQKAGFTAYSTQKTVNDKQVTRVLVGPVTKKTKAEQLVQKLQQQFNLKGIVVNYQV